MLCRNPAKFTMHRHFFNFLLLLSLLLLALSASAHNLSESNANYIEGLDGVAVAAFIYLGAKHMITGFDHLLFILGVVFFLYRPKDVLLYVSLFTLGHSLTLLTGVLANISVNPYLIDGIIGFSVVYKAFENMGGFERVFAISPDSRIAVLIFGLFHGFGLATKLQDLVLSDDGLWINMLSFNLGVEIGQLLILGMFLMLLYQWRQSIKFTEQAFMFNSILMCCGFTFMGYQFLAYLRDASNLIEGMS